MDSERVQQAAAMNGSDNEKNKVDLELRLELPVNDESPPKNQGQQFDPTLLAANNRVDLSHLAPHPLEENGAHFGAWPLQLGINGCYANPTKHCACPSTGVDLPPNQPPAFPGLPMMIVNNKNLFVDISQIDRMELGMSSSSNGPKKSSARCGRPCSDTNNANKRCANPQCNATASPLWRRGPLGPKTLCNACGIKYRKEEEKRKTEVIMQQLHELAAARRKPAA